MIKTYLIPEANLPEFEARFAKIEKKAKRMKLIAPTFLKKGHKDVEKHTEMPDGSIKHYVVRYFEVEVAGETPRYAGWTFVATLQHLQDESGKVINMLRVSPDHTGDLPEHFRSATADNCDHCHKRITTRKDTFVVVNEAGEYRQVGRSCTQAFLGGKDPHELATYLEFILSLDELGSEYSNEFGGRMVERESIESFLTVVAAMVRVDGWLSRSAARAQGLAISAATANSAWDFCFPPRLEGQALDKFRAWAHDRKPTEADEKLAAEALEYVRTTLAAKMAAEKNQTNHEL